MCVIIPSSTAEVERGFTVMKLLCTRLRASMLPSTLDILMQICLCGDSLTFEKVVDIYRNSVVDENDSGSQTKRCKISFWKILTKELIPSYSHTLDLSFFILFYKDSSSFVNLLIRLICQTSYEECNTALSSNRFVTLRMLCKYKKHSKFTTSALLLRAGTWTRTRNWYFLSWKMCHNALFQRCLSGHDSFNFLAYSV